jgi:shikimate kinase
MRSRFNDFFSNDESEMVSTTRKIVILGFMGCGKTEVARQLAKNLGRQMVDVDGEITTTTGRTPARLIVEEGERKFREVESNALRGVLAQDSGAVIALGGGAWIEAINRELIEDDEATTVWLDTPFDTCWSHISKSEEDRPLGRSAEQARELFERRRPVYELAQLRIQVSSDESIASVAERIQSDLATV